VRLCKNKLNNGDDCEDCGDTKPWKGAPSLLQAGKALERQKMRAGSAGLTAE